MGSINVHITLDITVLGQSYNLTCGQSYNITCCNTPGTYKVYYFLGSLILVRPGEDPPGSSGGDYTQVFCDPCKDKCSKDGNPLKYNGNEDWLFTTYVNNSPKPEAVLIDQFNVSKNFPPEDCNDVSGYKGLVTVDGESICCTLAGGEIQDEDLNIYKEPVQKELKDLLKAFQQPKIDTNGDPSEACLCGCPGFCGPSADQDCAGISSVLGAWRSFESENCTIDG